MHFKNIILTASTLALTVVSAQAQSHKYDTWEESYTVQALLGAVKYDDLKFESTDGSGGDPVEIDMTTIPQLGGAWATIPKGETLQYGLEASFLLGFKFDDVSAYLSGSGSYVSISTSMWMFDFAGGGYANFWLTDSIRLYGAGGPLMVFASYKSERDYESGTPDSSDSESAFGLGLYARTGVEFRIHQRGYLGLGARWNWSNADFTEVGGSSKVTGIAGFVTYTAGL